MFEAASLLYLYVETPLHAGSGRGLGAVDLPVQRERVTGYPLVQASSVKGKLRAEAEAKVNASDKPKLLAMFGPESGPGASDYAGAISPGDARLLLFPVRSLAGIFAWTTSVNVLARFLRDASIIGLSVPWTAPGIPDIGQALVAPDNDLTAGGKVVLEEFAFAPQSSDIVKAIAEWLAKEALPAASEYDYWRQKLPRSLVVLPENDFRDFTLFATEVTTRVRLDNKTKTVESGALWTEECLPADTLLYAPLQATRSRKDGDQSSGRQILEFATGLNINRVQLGGDETVGRGMVCLRYGEVRDV
ncbi:MAG TPA: type III-B CRISPR module RAMP protein Cmr4 [Chloroflexi bacterium]|nr:type III-B CRISPR module RAMP protein Cmr4 [Chloroflexota bacterium]